MYVNLFFPLKFYILNLRIPLQIAKYAKKNKKTLVFNLCGSYVCENHPEEMSQILPYVDILFGFVEEYKTLEKHVDLPVLASVQPGGDANIVTSLPCILQAVANPRCRKPSSSSVVHASTDASSHLPVSRKESAVSNGSPDSDCSDNCHFFDNSEVLYDTDDPVSPTFEKSNVLSVPSKVRRRSDNKPSKLCDTSQPQDNIVRPGTVLARRKMNGAPNGVPSSCSSMDDEFNFSDKVVIMTQGPLPLLYVGSDGIVREKIIEPLSPTEIVDTTGAGDSFVGGFLACLSQGKKLEECIDGGIYAARHILRQKGCSLPRYSADFL